MSDIVEAIILGIVQGLTEFLPISSSGHIEIVEALMGESYSGESSLLLTVTLHAATALATIFVFWREIAQIFKGLFQFKWNDELAFSLKIILSMIPAALVGLTMEDWIESLFDSQLLLVGIMLIVTSGLLFLADKAKTTEQDVSFGQSIIIGIAQAIAILPGISRSGATIATSVLLGIDRTKAARFSFLMVVPLIFGKMAKDILDGGFAQADISTAAISAGFIAAFATGILACVWMIKLVQNAKLRYFSLYCLLAAGVAIWLAYN